MTEIKKEYLRTSEVSERTGVPIHRVKLIAHKHLNVSKYVNGEYKFKISDLEKIKEIDGALKIKLKGSSEKKINKKEVAKIQKKIEFLGTYMNEQLLKLSKELSEALAD